MMETLRNIVIPVLWGMPGPAFMAVLVALFAEPDYNWEAGLDSFILSALDRIRLQQVLVLCEALLGLFYAMTRLPVQPTTVVQGLKSGSFFFFAFGFPLFILAVLFKANFGKLHELLFVVFVFLAHVVGGAIAGFHVEYFLLRMKPKHGNLGE